MQLLLSLLMMINLRGIECQYKLKYQINNAVQDYDISKVFALSPTRNQLVYCKKGSSKCVFSDISSLYQKRSFQAPSQVTEIKWFNDGTIYIAGSYWARIIEQFFPYTINNEVILEQNQTYAYEFDGIKGLIGVQNSQNSIMIFQDSELLSSYECQYSILDFTLISSSYFYIFYENSIYYSKCIAKIFLYDLSTIFQLGYSYKLLQILQLYSDYQLIIGQRSAAIYYRSSQRNTLPNQGDNKKVILSDDQNILYRSYSTYSYSVFQQCSSQEYYYTYSCDDQASIKFDSNITNFEINQDYFIFLTDSTMFVYTYEQPIPVPPDNFPYLFIIIGASAILSVVGLIVWFCCKRYRKNKKEHQQSLLKSSIKGDAYFAKMKAEVPSQHDEY